MVASPSDWCPRASGTGGYAHDDRINTGWVANGVIGFSWDASQGAVSGGVHALFKYPYVHVLRISEATKTRLDEPIIYSPKYAVEWPSLAANSAGDVGGSVMWGGGAFEENCAAVVHDSRSGPGFWEFHRLAGSSADTPQAKSGDYTTSRGVGNGWVSACYSVRAGSVHSQYFAFSRTSVALQPPCVVPSVVGKTLAKARAKITSRDCRLGKVTRRLIGLELTDAGMRVLRLVRIDDVEGVVGEPVPEGRLDGLPGRRVQGAILEQPRVHVLQDVLAGRRMQRGRDEDRYE